jgi:hypothetical protein
LWKIIFKKLNKQKDSKWKASFGGKRQQFGEVCEFLKKIPKNLNKKNLKLHKLEKLSGIPI